jgi:hypothetical protein
MPEVSEQELKVLTGAKQLLDTVMNNPKTRLHQERLIKANYPSAVTTDDRMAPFVGAFNELRNEVKALRDEKVSGEAKSKLDAGYEHLRSKRHYTDDGIDKIKAFQNEHGIPDPVVAADAWERRNPKPSPQQPSFASTWGFGDVGNDENEKLLWSNPDRFAEQETAAVLREFARGNDDY